MNDPRDKPSNYEATDAGRAALAAHEAPTLTAYEIFALRRAQAEVVGKGMSNVTARASLHLERAGSLRWDHDRYHLTDAGRRALAAHEGGSK